MNSINVCRTQTHVHIEVAIPGQRFVFLKYGTAAGTLAAYLPIKVLPLDCDGKGKYTFSCLNGIPEAATHIWVNAEDDRNIDAAPIPDTQELLLSLLQEICQMGPKTMNI